MKMEQKETEERMMQRLRTVVWHDLTVCRVNN